MRSPLFLASVLALALAAPAAAQTTLTVDAEGFVDPPSAPIALSAANTQVQVRCQGTDCRQAAFRVENSAGRRAPVARGAASQAGVTLTLNAAMLNGAPSGSLVLVSGEQALGRVPLSGPGPDDNDDDPRSSEDGDTVRIEGAERTLGDLLTADCRRELRPWQDSLTYSAPGDWARFVVTPVGNVVFRPGDEVDENDRVQVVVVGDARLVPRLKVTRQSAFRAPGSFAILGADQELPFELKSAAGCAATGVLLSDFQPGQGQVQIATINDDGSQTAIGGFDFGVHTLYAGAFSLGAIRTELRDPTFGVAAVGPDTVLTRTEDGTPRVLYVLSYTPFIWGQRDVQKPVPFIEHVNPMVGVVLNDIADNALVGLSIDLMNSLYLQVGAHAGRVTRLDPRGGVRLGDPFTQPASEIPTVTEWGVDWFIGASLDLRAAVQLLRTATTGGNTP